MHPRPPGRRRPRRLSGRRVRVPRGDAADARVDRRHLDRRDQRRPDRRQPAGASGRAAARVLGDGLLVPVRAPVYGAPTNESGGRDIVNEASDDRDAVRRLRLLRAARAGGAVQATRHAGGDQLHDTEPLRRSSSSWSTSAPQLGRVRLSVGAVSVKAATSSTSTAGTGGSTPHIMASGALPPGFRRSRSTASLLGRRAGLEHAAAIRARPAGHGRGWCSRSTCSPPAADAANLGRRASGRRTSATRAGPA